MNWLSSLPIMLAGYSDGNAQGKKLALRELTNMARAADIAQPAIEALQDIINDPGLMGTGKILSEMSEAAKGRLKPELKDKLKAYEGVLRALELAREFTEKNK